MTALLTIETDADQLERDLCEAKLGSSDAFEILVREHESMVFSIALHSLRNRAVAEDVAQEIFLQLYRSIGQIESASHLTFWLRRVTTNRCIDLIRREKEAQLDEKLEVAAPSSSANDPFLSQRLHEAVSSLPAQQRLAVVLRYQEELEPSEISSMLDVPLSTVKSHLYRALAALRRQLGEATLRVAGGRP